MYFCAHLKPVDFFQLKYDLKLNGFITEGHCFCKCTKSIILPQTGLYFFFFNILYIVCFFFFNCSGFCRTLK